MANNKHDFLTGMLFIAVIISIALGFGNTYYKDSTITQYLDFNQLDLLNVSGVTVIDNDTNEYNSLQFSNFSRNIGDTFMYNLTFDDINVSKLKDYELEFKFSYNLTDPNDMMDFLKIYPNSNYWLGFRSIEFGESSFNVARVPNIDHSALFRYRVYNDDKFVVIEFIPDEDETNKIIGIFDYDSVSITNNFLEDPMKLVIEDDQYNTTISSNSYFRIDYIKLTYNKNDLD